MYDLYSKLGNCISQGSPEKQKRIGRINTEVYIYYSVYMHTCINVCVCVWVWREGERERERQRDGKIETKRERESFENWQIQNL